MTGRDVLGEFSSVVCFKAVIAGVEDTLGPDGAATVFIRAGKVRGANLATSLGLAGSNLPADELARSLNQALGADGTRLCAVSSARQSGDVIEIDTDDTVCSAGEPAGSDRQCTFTLGAVWGALEAVTGKTYIGKHTASPLRGGAHDTFTFTPR